jgi:hypothetical protein
MGLMKIAHLLLADEQFFSKKSVHALLITPSKRAIKAITRRM